LLRIVTIALLALLLTACGGGDPEDQEPEPPDVQTPGAPACSASRPSCK
jgi:hypothetical protein